LKSNYRHSTDKNIIRTNKASKCLLWYVVRGDSVIYFCILKLALQLKKEILVKFGEKVRDSRKEKGLSQEQLAFKADLHRTYIGMIERAEKNISLTNIYKIASALGVSLADLLKEIE
jgi:DNA-binding XRE family transcriptional regulator